MKYNKYKAVKTKVNNIQFDSYLEAQRYRQLKLLEEGEVISGLVIQPKFALMSSYKYKGKTVRGINYIADFMYIEDGKKIVEDVKGARTKEYIIKSKLFIKRYIIDSKEIDEFRELQRGDF